jgi:hypothetical protein
MGIYLGCKVSFSGDDVMSGLCEWKWLK